VLTPTPGGIAGSSAAESLRRKQAVNGIAIGQGGFDLAGQLSGFRKRPHLGSRAARLHRVPHEPDERRARHTGLPLLLNVDEAAGLLRTSRRAIYAMIERRQLPGVTRVRRRVLLRADDLLNWLDQKRTPSPQQ